MFAGIIRLSAEGGCSQTHVGTSSRRGVTMTFGDDGVARACRAMNHHDVYVSTSESAGALRSSAEEHRTAEQQGFSGRYTKRGVWLDVALSADDSVCAHKREGMPAVDVKVWRLECLPVMLDHVTASALVCRSPNDGGMGEYGVGGLVRDDNEESHWIALAKGDGVEIDASNHWYVAFNNWSAETTDPPSTLLRGEPWAWITP
jgi:hypothetical protein